MASQDRTYPEVLDSDFRFCKTAKDSMCEKDNEGGVGGKDRQKKLEFDICSKASIKE